MERNNGCNWRNPAPSLHQPHIVGYMSVDASRNYCPDLSQLKFVNSIPQGRLSWDLNHNIDNAVKRTTDDNDEKLDLLIKFILTNKIDLPSNIFITYRSTLIGVMYTVYDIKEPVCIRACLYKNNIYMKEIPSQQEIHRRQNRSEDERRFCAWGYKFEQYMSSDQPHLVPNVDRPVVENEEFSLVYVSEIGDNKLFYGAQVDGLLATTSTSPKPDTTNVQEINNYLRKHDYIELKTNKEILNPKQERNFKRYKMLRCWCQCYLANYKGLLVGYRNDQGIVQRLQWFDTKQIVEYCKHEWSPQATLNFLDYFLTFVKNSFQLNVVRKNTNDPLTLDFYININRKIKVECNLDRNALLPDWYLEAMK